MAKVTELVNWMDKRKGEFLGLVKGVAENGKTLRFHWDYSLPMEWDTKRKYKRLDMNRFSLSDYEGEIIGGEPSNSWANRYRQYWKVEGGKLMEIGVKEVLEILGEKRNPLARFSTEELLAELKRRKGSDSEEE